MALQIPSILNPRALMTFGLPVSWGSKTPCPLDAWGSTLLKFYELIKSTNLPSASLSTNNHQLSSKEIMSISHVLGHVSIPKLTKMAYIIFGHHLNLSFPKKSTSIMDVWQVPSKGDSSAYQPATNNDNKGFLCHLMPINHLLYIGLVESSWSFFFW